jgi:hypothetical protein
MGIMSKLSFREVTETTYMEGPHINEKLPIIMLTGSAETPRDTEISTSNKSPPIKIANATHNGLIHLYKQN